MHRHLAIAVGTAALVLLAPTTAHAAQGPTVLAPPFDSASTYTSGSGTVLACEADESGSVHLDVASPPGGFASCYASFSALTFRVTAPGSRVDIVLDVASADSPLPDSDFFSLRGVNLCAEFDEMRGHVGAIGCRSITGVAGVPTSPQTTWSFTAPERGEYALGLWVSATAAGHSVHASIEATLSSVTLYPPSQP